MAGLRLAWRIGPPRLPRMKQLPEIFTVVGCAEDCWLAVWRGHQTFERRQLDAAEFIPASDVGSIAPELPAQPLRGVPRRSN